MTSQHRILALLTPLAVVFLLAGCGTAQRFNDALRIRPDSASKYGNVPGTMTTRDGRTLRGTVKQVVITPSKTDSIGSDTMYVFLDARAEDRPENYELIPIGDVERVGALMNLPRDTVTNNINVVESFNNTEMIPQLRRVPMAVYRAGQRPQPSGGGGGGNPCDCQPLSLNLSLPSLECPERTYDWFFVEGRAVYASFVDLRADGSEAARTTLSGDLAFGLRFGAGNEWGLGLMTSLGNTVNDIGDSLSTPVMRPTVMAHLRYQSPGPVTSFLGICLKPYGYANLGITLDSASLKLMNLNLNTECEPCEDARLAATLDNPSIDLDFPISFGFGLGVEFPVTEWLDIGIDVGYRRLAVGDEVVAGPIKNLPTRRAVDMFLLRFGATY